MRISRRVAVLALGLALLIAAGVVARVLRPSSGDPRFVRDTFNYRLGGRAFYTVPPPVDGDSSAELTSLSASSAHNAWILGSFGGADAFAWQWAGRAWRNVPLPKVPGAVEFESVAAVGDHQAWVVGSYADPVDRHAAHGLVERWDGRRWWRVALPDGAPQHLVAVAADGPRDVWAIGGSLARYAGRLGCICDVPKGTRPLLVHWDGAAWNTVAFPGTSPFFPGEAQVVANGPADVWVVRFRERIEHWDGKRWQVVPEPFGPSDVMQGFDATSGDDAWGVGDVGGPRRSRTLAAHWDGQSWQIAPTPTLSAVYAHLSNVVAVTPNDAWAVGSTQRSNEYPGDRSLFEHWDGTRWAVVPFPSLLPDALAASDDGRVWAMGACTIGNRTGRWDGSAWTLVRHPQDIRWGPTTPLRVRRLWSDC